MIISEIKPNMIVRGSIFPEPVKVITIIAMGDSIKLIGEGMVTGKVHQPILKEDQVVQLEVSSEKEPFDGDPAKFRLGIEVMRLGLAYEYAARKIAQGLGAYLKNLGHLVNIKRDTATLLSAGARTRYLFGKDAGEGPKGRKKKKSKQKKFDFMGELKEMEEESGDWAGDLSGRPGSTVLDQLHQSMILFGAGRSEALKRFLVEDGVGLNPLYWRLAQALSALYPCGTDEKRWVDGVLARKKGLGF